MFVLINIKYFISKYETIKLKFKKRIFNIKIIIDNYN